MIWVLAVAISALNSDTQTVIGKTIQPPAKAPQPQHHSNSMVISKTASDPYGALYRVITATPWMSPDPEPGRP